LDVWRAGSDVELTGRVVHTNSSKLNMQERGEGRVGKGGKVSVRLEVEEMEERMY
jgi:hypothetical protein